GDVGGPANTDDAAGESTVGRHGVLGAAGREASGDDSESGVRGVTPYEVDTGVEGGAGGQAGDVEGGCGAAAGGTVKDVVSGGVDDLEAAAVAGAEGCAPGEANRVLRVEVPALEVLGVGGGVGVEVDVEAGDL